MREIAALSGNVGIVSHRQAESDSYHPSFHLNVVTLTDARLLGLHLARQSRPTVGLSTS